jgi:hypothetical protein
MKKTIGLLDNNLFGELVGNRNKLETFLGKEYSQKAYKGNDSLIKLKIWKIKKFYHFKTLHTLYLV